MIKIFDSNVSDFSTNGNIVIKPLKCIETKKKSLNGWYIDVEVPIKYKDYILQDKLCVIKTKSKLNPQAFSIYDISYNNSRIIFKAEHIAFRSRDYFLVDCRPTNLDGNNALNYINDRTDNISPFTIISDVETISTAYFVRKSLLEAWTIIEEKWHGVFDFDNYNVYFKQNIGNDNGEIVAYGKNLQDFNVFEDWSNVVTKLYPVGYNGTLLPEKYVQSDIQYNKLYTRTIDFGTDLESENQTEENLINELREKANLYLQENQYPKVSYEIVSNIVQNVEIGDIIHVKHPLILLNTEVQEYEYNILTKKVQKLIFGNYNRDVKAKFDSIKNIINTTVNKVSTQDEVIANQTKIINSLNKNGHLYIDDNELFVLDELPKENAKNVLRLGLGGIGLSDNGIEGPFKTAITLQGINGDLINAGTIKTDRIEGYSQLITSVSNALSISGDNALKISQTQRNVSNIQNLFQITGGNNLIKNSVGLFKDENWIKSENGIFEFGEDSDLIGKTTSRAKISISNGRLTTSSSNIVDLTLNEQKTLNFKAKQDENTTTTITLYGLDENNPLYSKTFTEAFDWQEVFTPEENQFFIDSPNLTLVINSTSTYDGKFYISDLMLNNGDKTEWQLSRGEVSSTTIKMTQDGITVYMNTKNIATLLNADGLQIRKLNGNLIGDIVTEFNSDGIFTKNIEHTGQYVQKNYVRDVTMYNGFETYFDYIRG